MSHMTLPDCVKGCGCLIEKSGIYSIGNKREVCSFLSLELARAVTGKGREKKKKATVVLLWGGMKLGELATILTCL